MMGTAKKSLNKELPTVFWVLPQSSEISESSSAKVTPENIGEWLISSREDSPVSPSVSQENGPEKTIPEICGRKRSKPFAWYGQVVRCWRTYRGYFRPKLKTKLCDISGEFSEIWPKSGIMRDGRCWELTMPERPIGEKGCGLWPTPQHRDYFPPHSKEYIEKKKAQGHGMRNLNDEVMWPTPNQTAYPTLRGGGKTGDVGMCGGTGAYEQIQKLDVPEGEKKAMAHGKGGQLNPDWVEWLMGWPIGWTDLKPLAMDRFRRWRHLHGEF